jgi:uncharacterized protein YabE (DUF348 family)
MIRKSFPYPTALLAAFLLVTACWYLLRPVQIVDGTQTTPIPAKGGWIVAQVLQAAGISLAPEDQVEPGPYALVPLNGQIRIRRAIQAWVWEDGQMHTAFGPGPSAFDLLAQNKISLEPEDRLLWNGKPATEEALPQTGQPLVLQIIRAKTVRLDIAGQPREIQTTAASAARALWEAGVQVGPGSRLSADPASLPSSSSVIAYQPGRAMTIQVGGQTLAVQTTAATVGEALAETGLSLQGMDYSLPAEDQPVPADGRIRVVRVLEEISLNQTLLPYETVYEPLPDLEMDAQQTINPGQYGVKVERTRARFEDGQEISRGVDSDWTASEPVAQTIGTGAKVVMNAAGTAEGGINYWKAVEVYATSYSPCQQGLDHCSWGTSSGARLTKGIIGVTHSWYVQLAGQQVYIPGYGYGVIGDVGGGIPGKPWIDLGWDEENYQPMGGWMTMYLLGPAPANPSEWSLP